MSPVSRYAALLRGRSPRALFHALARRCRSFAYGLGNRVQCQYCGWTGSRFFPAGARQTPNRKCPRCGSLERHRLLYLYLEKSGLLNGRSVRVLEIAPKACFSAYCRGLPNVSYVSMDLQTEGAQVLTDLTRAGLRTGAFDIVVCFHVLEHIPDDAAALCEIRRLLRPDGTALLQVPLSNGASVDGPELDADERTRRFGQDDHVRLYGRDIVGRCRAAGLATEIDETLDQLPGGIVRRHALEGDDRVVIVARPDRQAAELSDGSSFAP